MTAKYFVWGEGVWREVDVASGRVSGWRRRARFVFLRRGKLLVARRKPVLRALEALAKGQPSAAADGPRLAYRSKSESRKHKHEHEPPLPAAPPPCAHHHCCVHNGCHRDRREAATQSARDVATGTEPPAVLASPRPARVSPRPARASPRPARASPRPALAARSPHALLSSGDEFLSTRARRAGDVSALLGKHAPPAVLADTRRKPASKHAALPGDDRARRVSTRTRPAATSDKTDSTSADEPLQRGRGSSYRQGPAVCKELIVSEADIAALRSYVARARPSALYRFDADDGYKRALFYAINPLVELERCARLERLLWSRSAAALPHFAARLGLAPRSDGSAPPSPAPRRTRVRTASSDTDKENKDKHSSPNKVRSEPLGATKQAPAPRATERADTHEKEVAAMKAPLTNGFARESPRLKRPAAAPEPRIKKAVLESEGSGAAPTVTDVPRPVPAGTHVISKRASRANVAEYSNLEDHAIVAWLSVGARATLVGGNRVWRELQDQYERLTGRARSWHSLRNRYLRYILPSLGALHLAPAEVSRLRAAAATGAIKRHDRASGLLAARRHSTPARGHAPLARRASPPARRASPPARRASPPARRASPPARGAATGRARALLAKRDSTSDDDSTDPPSTKRRSLRVRQLDSTVRTPSSSKDDSGKESPSKASNSKETSNKDESGKESASKASGSKPPGSKASGNKASGSRAASSKTGSGKARSPRYSEVTRRFAAAHRGALRGVSSSASPVSSDSPSPPSLPPRSRRLFNPNANA